MLSKIYIFNPLIKVERSGIRDLAKEIRDNRNQRSENRKQKTFITYH